MYRLPDGLTGSTHERGHAAPLGQHDDAVAVNCNDYDGSVREQDAQERPFGFRRPPSQHPFEDLLAHHCSAPASPMALCWSNNDAGQCSKCRKRRASIEQPRVPAPLSRQHAHANKSHAKNKLRKPHTTSSSSEVKSARGHTAGRRAVEQGSSHGRLPTSSRRPARA